MMTPQQIDAPAANSVGILFAPGDATEIQTLIPGVNGIGDPSPGGATGGLGFGAASALSGTAPYLIAFLCLGLAVTLG